MSTLQKPHPDASPLNGVVPPESTRWKPGQVTNPGGIPKSVVTARRMAAKATPEIIARMTEIALKGEEKYAIPAAALVLERGLGKAAAMRELYPKAAAKEETALQSDIAGLTDDQRARIFSILREGAM